MSLFAPRLSRSLFIVSPGYDISLFLLSPLLALGIGVLLSISHFNDKVWVFGGVESAVTSTLIGIFIHAHLFIVVFRSHLNPAIRKLYPIRFFLVPPLLLLGMVLSDWVLVSVSVLATFWDVYHSGLQTFGLGRIYDRKAGNNPKQARRLDLILNHLLYAGPIVAGATMLDHFEDFHEFDDLGTTFFSVVPAFMESNQRYFAWGLLVFGGLFLAYYLFAYLRLAQQGYNVSPLKVVLLASTGLCSIYSWGFNSWGEAFFIMNFFHALQYFALVWWQEQGNLARLLRTARLKLWKPVTLLAFVAIGVSYGVLVEATTTTTFMYPLSLVVSIMHFWYDGFIWSVQKQQV